MGKILNMAYTLQRLWFERRVMMATCVIIGMMMKFIRKNSCLLNLLKVFNKEGLSKEDM